MIKTLGLDISSSVIGWSVISSNGKDVCLYEYGHILPPPSKKGSLAFRMNSAFDDISNLLRRVNPDVVSIESYVNKFSHKKSSARTIIVLSSFNEVISMACIRELGFEAEKYTVGSIRSIISKEYSLDVKSKDDVINFVNSKFDNFIIRKNKNNNISKTVYDESDSIAVALASVLTNYKDKKNV